LFDKKWKDDGRFHSRPPSCGRQPQERVNGFKEASVSDDQDKELETEDNDVEAHQLGGKDTERDQLGGKDTEREALGGRDV